ncbi:MAG: branched-chain amino acid ABC transporter permease [Actinobacteria bacterium 69-20]|jgi:branched-chain amino acid transport system permease protein|nr:branched-chain amino acid ABC transporter permease [Actinomycetota bacterium]OJV30150.1 MAG: branched-chain amino acid ABC transporter permease [Actinobacteria bacterium 69-20]
MDWGGIFSSALSDMLGPSAAIYALAAVGLNLHFGYTGLLNFGQVAFMLVGSYGVGVSVAKYGLPLSVSVLVAILVSVVLALLLGVPTLRLRGDYLAIATIAVGEILRLFVNSSYFEPLTGGSLGLTDPALAGSGPQRLPNQGFTELSPFVGGKTYDFGPLHFLGSDLWVMVVTWALVILACVLMFLLMRSPWGRVLRSVREDELAARSLGKNVFSFKMQSLVLGGVIGGLAGVMYTMNIPGQVPTNFMPEITFYLWVIVILGGAGRIVGPVIGALIFWFVFSFLGSFLTDLFPGANANVGAVRIAVVGVILMLLMVFRPAGILGNKEEMRLEVR